MEEIRSRCNGHQIYCACSFCGLGLGGGDYEDDEGKGMIVLHIV